MKMDYKMGGSWGFHIEWINTNSDEGLTIGGHWTPIPKTGETIISKMSSGKTGIFKIAEVRTFTDPGDQFFADVIFVGYMED